ncbi:hypothetical protein B566_EDAN007107 [Ephemera danica]|nr:hypothetical protein B566_EDAN007107 [Ephemera danica]
MVPEHAGHLVSQILGAQRELEPQRDALGQEETSGWHSGETWRHSEVTRLREAVQGLVRAANPLGRLLDFLQEDVEAMQLELETWQTENQELRAHIAREARATAESMAPLERELAALEAQAEQQRVAMTSLKTVVLANEKRLTEMLLKL